MKYVIKKMNSALYVSNPGRKNAYTNRLEHARKFDTLEQAAKDSCGNEYPIPLDFLN